MPRLCFALMLVGFATSSVVAQAPEQGDPQPVVEWTRTHVRALDSSDGASGGEFNAFRGMIGTARVIGLGEAEHGVGEFFMLRNAFVKFCVESLGVTAITAETGYTESTAVDDYVLGRRELTPEVIGAVFSWSSDTAYAENRALLEWLRSHNNKTSTIRRVHFYGIDLTGGREGRFTQATRSLEAALAYVAATEPIQEHQLQARLRPLMSHFASGAYDSLSVDQQNALTTAIDDLISLFERRSLRWPAATSYEAFNRAYRSAIVAKQLNANFRAASAESNPQAQRESAMAENLMWVLQQEGPRGRVLLYEANWHISKGPMESDRWGSSLGEYLHSLLGSDYFAIGTSFGEKVSGAPDTSSTADSASVARLLSEVCAARCWLNFQDVPKNGPVADWFDAVRPLQGGRVDRLVPRLAFDAQIFIRAAHPAEREASSVNER
jgi:erythromycin esterase